MISFLTDSFALQAQPGMWSGGPDQKLYTYPGSRSGVSCLAGAGQGSVRKPQGEADAHCREETQLSSFCPTDSPLPHLNPFSKSSPQATLSF